MLFQVWLGILDLYLFHSIVLLNLIFNCSDSLLLSWIGKVTTGPYSFVSFISNVAFDGLLIPAIAGSASRSACCLACYYTSFRLSRAKDALRLVNSISNVL